MRPLFLVDVLKICRWMEKKKKINLLQLRKHMQTDLKKKYIGETGNASQKGPHII